MNRQIPSKKATGAAMVEFAIVLPLLLITVFLGGIVLTFPGVIWTLVKYVVLLVVIVLIRNTNPRLRIDHAVKFFWYILTPVSLVALLLALAGY